MDRRRVAGRDIFLCDFPVLGRSTRPTKRRRRLASTKPRIIPYEFGRYTAPCCPPSVVVGRVGCSSARRHFLSCIICSAAPPFVQTTFAVSNLTTIMLLPTGRNKRKVMTELQPSSWPTANELPTVPLSARQNPVDHVIDHCHDPGQRQSENRCSLADNE